MFCIFWGEDFLEEVVMMGDLKWIFGWIDGLGLWGRLWSWKFEVDWRGERERNVVIVVIIERESKIESFGGGEERELYVFYLIV